MAIRGRRTHPILFALEYKLNSLAEPSTAIHRIQLVERSAPHLANPSLVLRLQDERRERGGVERVERLDACSLGGREAEEVLEEDEHLDEDLAAEVGVGELRSVASACVSQQV